MRTHDLDEMHLDWWCAYCKEPIDPKKGFVVKEGNTYHLHCWKLLIEDSDGFGESFE